MKTKALAALAAVTFALTVLAQADDYPSRSMTMVIPFAAGGPTDVLGRMVAGRMSEILHQNVIVENINGAGGQTGSLRVANSAADGYEFVLATVGTHAQGQTLYQHPLYNAVTDFTPVILIANVPLVLVARKDLPVANFKEFVAYTKENQAKMQFGSAGTGSATHLGCLLMNYLLKVNVTHVPYRGSGPAMQDLQGGRIDYLCDVMTTAKPPIDSGAVKGLAVLNAKRSPALPDVPTAVEQGMPDLIAYTWNAIFLPKNAPAPIVKKLHDADRCRAPARHQVGQRSPPGSLRSPASPCRGGWFKRPFFVAALREKFLNRVTFRSRRLCGMAARGFFSDGGRTC
jgi:tripartite-type tricarboxylate transporter receptor subunit TctC